MTISGTLFRKKNAKLGDPAGWMIRWPTKKGGSATAPVPPDQLTDNLRSAADGEIEVDLDLESGRPKRIRPLGEAWEAPQMATAAAAAQTVGRHGHQRRDSGRRDHKIGGNGQPSRAGLENAGPKFYNPYNFIPTPPRIPSGPLADAEKAGLPGQGRYLTNRFSGRLTVIMTVVTPLLVLDTARATEDDNDHKTFPIRLATDGRTPYIPPTSVKGMLRAAYEAVTNSRLGVFAGHSDRLGYRLDARLAPSMVPARVDPTSKSIELLLGTNAATPMYSGRWDPPGRLMYAAFLAAYPPKTALPYHGTSKLPQHNEHVGFWAKKCAHRSGRFDYWEVQAIVPFGSPRPLPPSPTCKWFADGWTCITYQNIGKKHYERAFFSDLPAGKIVEPLRPDWIKRYNNLVGDYRRQATKSLEDRRKLGISPRVFLNEQIGNTAFSRHIFEPGEDRLQPGTLCYLRYDQAGKPVGLYPVMISRELYQSAPSELLDATLFPASTTRQLSPADRVFGWVGQEGKGAYRGNLRIGPVNLVHKPAEGAIETVPREGIPLTILGEPKPSQSSFYVARDKTATEPLPNGTPKTDSYLASQGLRGRKVYPHHRALPANYWENARDAADQQPKAVAGNRFREYLRARPMSPDEQQRDDQNRSISAWIRPKTKFSFNIQVTNLTKEELGALLWLLNLPHDHHHRFGGGKPLGFGSVCLELAGLDLADGAALRERYRGFEQIVKQEHKCLSNDDLKGKKIDDTVDAFTKAVAEAYGNGGSFDDVHFIRAFRNAAKGIGSDQQPVHYPRVKDSAASAYPPPRAKGENFKWFQKNEKKGHHALPSLVANADGEVEPLPIFADK